MQRFTSADAADELREEVPSFRGLLRRARTSVGGLALNTAANQFGVDACCIDRASFKL